jgi:hypothetical protein
MSGDVTHLAHAVATFSELGIATAAVLLADLPKWRGLIDAGRADPIEVENLKVQAKRLGKIWYVLSCVAEKIPGDEVQYALPFVAFILGVLALVGISHVPMQPFTYVESWFDGGQLDIAYWWMGLASFLVSMLSVVVERTNAKVAQAADKTIDTPLDA